MPTLVVVLLPRLLIYLSNLFSGAASFERTATAWPATLLLGKGLLYLEVVQPTYPA